jgi:hypothetical protein
MTYSHFFLEQYNIMALIHFFSPSRVYYPESFGSSGTPTKCELQERHPFSHSWPKCVTFYVNNSVLISSLGLSLSHTPRVLHSPLLKRMAWGTGNSTRGKRRNSLLDDARVVPKNVHMCLRCIDYFHSNFNPTDGADPKSKCDDVVDTSKEKKLHIIS